MTHHKIYEIRIPHILTVSCPQSIIEVKPELKQTYGVIAIYSLQVMYFQILEIV